MEIKRDFGPQPMGALLVTHDLSQHDLVAASTKQITHKMVNRAVRGRRLTAHVMVKIQNALNHASGKSYVLTDLFNYAP